MDENYKINPDPIDEKNYLLSYHDEDVINSFPVQPDLWLEMPDSNEILDKKIKCYNCNGNGFIELKT